MRSREHAGPVVGLSAKDTGLAIKQREADERAERARFQRAGGRVPTRR